MLLRSGVTAASTASAWLLWLIAGNFGSLGYQEPVLHNSSKEFKIIWNVPSFMCHKYGMDFSQVSEKFGILQNEGDEFRGDKIAILYDPGNFPAILKDDRAVSRNRGPIGLNPLGYLRFSPKQDDFQSFGQICVPQDDYVRRNGGVPQEGNLTLHLNYLRRHVIEQIPQEDFSGLAVIDFESWRPIFRQNWASLQIYRELSLEIERKRHPFWSQRAIQQEASDRFERAARIFMQRSLELVQKLRPNASWAYYAYPYCFNWTPGQNSAQCSSKAINENDQMVWLFGGAKLLVPSMYLQRRLDPRQRVSLVRGRVQEAVRLAKKTQLSQDAKVLAYYWYKYQDDQNSFVDKRDLTSTISEIAKRGADGTIIWGSSNDFDSESKCNRFHEYFLQILGPTLKRLQQQFNASPSELT